MIWSNEDKLIMYVGQRIFSPEAFNKGLSITTILPPLVDVVGLTCGATDSSRLYFIQGKDMNVKELPRAKYHKNSKHITIETVLRIYTTDKKALFDYYKEQFHKLIQYIESSINIRERIVNTANTIRDTQYALKEIQKYREIKVNTMNAYRQTIETIKKL